MANLFKATSKGHRSLTNRAGVVARSDHDFAGGGLGGRIDGLPTNAGPSTFDKKDLSVIEYAGGQIDGLPTNAAR